MMKSQVMLVTPTLAAQFLATSRGNRNLRRSMVDKMKSDLVTGRFKCNGATIVFDVRGVMVDGHHRCTAIVESKVPIRMVIVTNIEEDASDSIDRNATVRTGSDILKLEGRTYSVAQIAAARILASIYDQNLSTKIISDLALTDFARSHPLLEEACHLAAPIARTLPHSIVSAWYYMARNCRGMEALADEALQVLITGVPAYKNDAMHAARERIIRMQPHERSNSKGRMLVMWTLLAAWSQFVNRIQITNCKIRTVPPEFPSYFDLSSIEIE